ncbi:MAG: hypothetical protein O7D30_11300 [Rickettsia endosymbiont of Ixodes persulcatus]|nr:hypothetical protein [Rickettsia endosymbiont of Ixodes persulcatus]
MQAFFIMILYLTPADAATPEETHNDDAHCLLGPVYTIVLKCNAAVIIVGEKTVVPFLAFETASQVLVYKRYKLKKKYYACRKFYQAIPKFCKDISHKYF